ncbi:MAG: 50S ribosomal protein L22 [Candidatus Chisholmbacteria bacterium]|nr:50S ribosomal protein L22 [Candidatus Chisholmbacteria bacterium]
MSARKVNLVAAMSRKLTVEEAQNRLKLMPQRGAKELLGVLNQAVANAVNNLKFNKEELKIKKIEIGEGPMFKRWQAVSRGRAHPILKRTCHIRVVLEAEKGEGRGAKS